MPLFRQRPELLAGFREGQRQALEAVYWSYVERVERMVRFGFHLSQQGLHIPGAHPADVVDLVQEIFTRAFSAQARLGYDGLREYGPYLLTLARNVLIDGLRKRGREVPLDTLRLEPEQPAAAADDAALAWTDAETLSAVEAYLAALPPPARRLHELRYVQGLSQEAASAQLGISRQQLRTQEKQLREGLKKALRKKGLHDPSEEKEKKNQPDLAGARSWK